MGHFPHLKNLKWTVLDNINQVAEALSDRLFMAAGQVLKQHPYFRCVLAGGQTPQLAYQYLAEMPADWSRWQFYWGDERCLPRVDSQRNDQLAQALIRYVPESQVFPIPAELGPLAGAAAYEDILKAQLGDALFDVVILGMGEDGHTASLFPGRSEGQAAAALDKDFPIVVPVLNAPKPPPERVSLSLRRLNQSRQIFFIVTGSNKQAALAAWRAGQDLPVQWVRAQAQTEVLVDRAAWGKENRLIYHDV